MKVGAATAVREATPVHRLGRGTSGVLLCARSQAAREGLSRAFAEDAKGERRQALNAYVGFTPLGEGLVYVWYDRGASAGSPLEIRHAPTAPRVRSPKEVLCVVGDADGVGLLVRVRVAKVESCFTLGSL